MTSERSRLCPDGATSVAGLGKEAEGEGTPLTVKGSFLKFRWRMLMSFVVLWVAYVFINAAFSVVGPFFPLEVSHVGLSALQTTKTLSRHSLSGFLELIYVTFMADVAGD